MKLLMEDILMKRRKRKKATQAKMLILIIKKKSINFLKSIKKNKEKKMLEKINEILARNENNESSIDEQSFPFNKEKNLNNLEFE